MGSRNNPAYSNTVLQEKSEIFNRFADYFAQLLNIPGTLDAKAAMGNQERPEVHCLSEPRSAIDATRESKAPGKCGIPSKILKYEGATVMSKLHQLVFSVWREESAPQNWRDASIISIFKKSS